MQVQRINPKMQKRLEWVDRNDKILIQWVAEYVHKSGWQLPPDKTSDTAEEYVDAFLENARFFEETATIRENCRNMKSAWYSKKKRMDNKQNKTIVEGYYTISITARKELERLATQHNHNFSKVIDTLLINAKKIEHLQRDLSKSLKEVNYGYRVNTQFLSTFFADEKAYQQTEIMTQNLKQEIENNKKQHRKELEKLKEKLKDAQKEIVELTAIIEE